MAVLNVNGSVSLVSRGNAVQREGRMSYAEFVWFLISEEDKKNFTRYNTVAWFCVTKLLFEHFSPCMLHSSQMSHVLFPNSLSPQLMSVCVCLWCVTLCAFVISLSSIEYWFRCMDMDGDGVLFMFELEYFYEEQCERMERMGIEPLPFQDLLCQMLDLVKPESQG